MAELGYGEDIYKLALLNDRQRSDLVVQLKVLPGHSAKLVSLFDVIDEVSYLEFDFILAVPQESRSRIVKAVYSWWK